MNGNKVESVAIPVPFRPKRTKARKASLLTVKNEFSVSIMEIMRIILVHSLN